MKIDTLHDLCIHGIQNMRTGCAWTFEGMERMRDAATDDGVRQLVQGGHEAMNGAMELFDRILERHGVATDATSNKALKALADEAIEWTDLQYGDALKHKAGGGWATLCAYRPHRRLRGHGLA